MTTDITYERLDRVLRGIGFQPKLSPTGARVYEHSSSGAKLFYPAGEATGSVLPHHLAATRWTLDMFSVASPVEFDNLLQKAG